MTRKTHEALEPSTKPRNASQKRGPLGDVIPEENEPDPRTGGARPQEKVEDRPEVSEVDSDDYPDDFKAKGG